MSENKEQLYPMLHNAGDDASDSESSQSAGLLERVEHTTRKPSKYVVYLLNDDYTPMEFVVWVLQTIFGKAHSEAQALMYQVHTEGKGAAGRYSFDVARTKSMQVESLAEKNGHPLKCELAREGQ